MPFYDVVLASALSDLCLIAMCSQQQALYSSGTQLSLRSVQDQHCEDVEASLGLDLPWHCTWNCSQAAKGYSGTAVISR